MAQDDIVATITRAINQENLKLMSLTDFAPTQTTSLQPGNFTEGGASYLLGVLKVDALKPKDISEEQFISVIEEACGISCDSEWGTLQELGL